jgi:hypothetical protein
MILPALNDALAVFCYLSFVFKLTWQRVCV